MTLIEIMIVLGVIGLMVGMLVVGFGAGRQAELTRARARHVAAGDAARLAEVEVVDGPAHRADLRLVEALAGARLDGLGVDVVEVTVVDGPGQPGGPPSPRAPDGLPAPGSPAPGAEAAVRVTSAMSAYTRVDAVGASTAVPASAPRTVVLALRWTADGWRVWDVTEE